MTPKQIKVLTNKLRSLVAFHKIRTVGEVLRELGYDSLAGYDPTAPITLGLLVQIIEVVTQDRPPVVKSAVEVKPPSSPASSSLRFLTDVELLPDLWAPGMKDSLIESDYVAPSGIDAFQFPPFHPKQVCKFLPYHGIRLDFQLKTAKQIYYDLFGPSNQRAALLRCNTGDGKTFALGQLVRWITDSGWLVGKTASAFPILYVTAASVVEQTKEVLRDQFGLRIGYDVVVTNYDALRASFGENVLTKETVVREGIEHTKWVFKRFLHPIVMIFDESQKAKNPDSQQTQIVIAASEINDPNVKLIFSSATPFSRISSAEYFCLATGKATATLSGRLKPLTREYWPTYSRLLSSPGEPHEYTKANMKRLVEEFKPWIYTFRNVRRKFKPRNNVMMVEFETAEEKHKYQLAWENYLDEKKRIEKQDLRGSSFLVLVQFLKFRQAAEIIRTRMGARMMWEAWSRDGFAPVWACNFKPTIAKIVLYLTQDYNIPRDKISIIWGGSSAWAGREELYTEAEIAKVITDALSGVDVPKKTLREIKVQLQQKANDLLDIPDGLRLGIQSKDQRWDEIQRFQNGRAEFCLFTFPSGGAGLSLHQNLPTLRQRRAFLAPTYNEMELIQGFGRTDRITSLSSTEQTILLYKNTIEQRVLNTMNYKRTGLDGIMKHDVTDAYEDEEARKLVDMQRKEVDDMKGEMEEEEEGAEDWEEGDGEEWKNDK